MVNGRFNFLACSGDLGLECGDAAMQFFDGPGIEILAPERGQRIVRALREKFVQVHNTQR